VTTATARSAANPLRRLVAKALSGVWRGVCATFGWAADQVPEVLLLGGAGAVTYGAAQVYRPAGWLVGGLLAVVLGWRLGRSVPAAKGTTGAAGG
jgi:hypothetical protein